MDKWVARENAARAMQTIASYHCLETPFPDEWITIFNPEPAPTHTYHVRKKSGIFLGGGEMVDHAESCVIKYYPISILYPR